MSGYTLVLPFDTDDPEFVRGFEVGRLWERMKLTPEPFEETVHSTNAEMVMRMAEAQKRLVSGTELDDMWMTVSFGEAPDAG
jgi:hypothetical protein